MNKPQLIEARFGMIAVKKGFVTREQVRMAVLAQKQALKKQNKSVLIGDILVQSGAITVHQRDLVLEVQQGNKNRSSAREETPASAPPAPKGSLSDRRFGMIAVKKGFASREQVKQAIYIQKVASQKNIATQLSDILLKTGIITAAQKDEVLLILGVASPVDNEEQKRDGDPDILPEPEDRGPQFLLTVSEDKLEVVLGPREGLPLMADLAEVRHAMEEYGIRHGVVADDLLAERLNEAVTSGEPVIVAQGRAPEDSRDDEIRYHFNAGSSDPTETGRSKSDESERSMVSSGDLVAEKLSGTAGKPGIDIYGEPIDTMPPLKLKLQCGTGVELSPDGTRAAARLEGIPEISATGEICVYPLMKIDGDVTRDDGDIEFDGHIEVDGAIEGKIRIAGRSLKAREVYESTIDLSGDMVVEKGISDARVTTTGMVIAKHANKAKIEALGDLILENEIIHSHIKTNGMCRIKRGMIRTSEVSARKGIFVKDVGSEISKPCKLTVGVDFWARKMAAKRSKEIKEKVDRRKELEQRLADLKKAISDLDQQINDMAEEETEITARQVELKNMLAAAGENGSSTEVEKLTSAAEEVEQQLAEINRAVEQKFEEQEKLSEEETRTKKEIEDFQNEITELKKKARKLEKETDRKKEKVAIEVTGTIYSKNTVAGEHAKLILPEKHTQVRITEGLFADAKSSVNWSMQIKKL